MSINPEVIKVGGLLYRKSAGVVVADIPVPQEPVVALPQPIEDPRINATLAIVYKSLKELKKLSDQFSGALMNKEAAELALENMRKEKNRLEQQISILKPLYNDYLSINADAIEKKSS